MNCCDKVRDLAIDKRNKEKTIANLERELKAEKQMRKKAESYYKELESFLNAKESKK
tara:strand:- start:5025 stop:5195 length:171 start_codon:yes stop_codon:yes gene_type:complete